MTATVFTVDAADDTLIADAHGLSVGDELLLSSTGTLPTGLSAEHIYYVFEVVDADTFKVARQPGDDEDAVEIDDTGTLVHSFEPARVGGLDRLYDDIVWWFESRERTESIVFGRDQIAQQLNQGTGGANRVVVAPGDPTGKAGKLTAARGMRGSDGRRSIYGWDELGQIRVWVADPNPNGPPASKHRRTDRALRALFEDVLCAVHESLCGRLTLGDPTFTVVPAELVYGHELTMLITMHGRIDDERHTKTAIDVVNMPAYQAKQDPDEDRELVETWSTDP